MDIIIFVVALSILVLIHEFGHFFAAKATGVKVEEFGLGLPPKIIGKKKWGTIWSLNWLPIGGFCKLFGEDPGGKGANKSKDSFLSKNPWQKALIVLGGVLMNLVLAVVVFATVYTIVGIPIETDKVKIIGIAKDSPAEKAGLKEGDWVKNIGVAEVNESSELTAEIEKYRGKEVQLAVDREGQSIALPVQVREKAPDGEGLMGVVISNTEMQKIKWYEFYKGIGAGFKEAYFWGKIIGGGVYQMITGLLTGNVPKDVAGPIGMFQATSSIRNNQGFLAMVHFFGVVSVNLAVVNVLPFPALDGGRIVFVLYELLTKKRANEKLEMIVNNVGMMILLGLILLVTIGDISRIFIK
ncbi:MAG: Membrane-associated zinc metalloprotease [Candidatus Shapirobacteria bacterium GW2011_GWE1_38_10]|uniref:Membrane-associated zinc metalloprotease n=1 Tax=Candidatus Shapirobacteria bacterium GW2011_GWE1_38_10 TaxID=1618488 RepID=A0A0G0I537_9BACT|nr:MAG: Membrane-associated zinc metalloprotease [Candidatus Shapirobacteria bacterium GW2011_GWE1_38_10]KKQ64620.1 MAG: Membrane-associated zinc metalloprotease [Candidatus Shapirobacteria bacterium GW2011_GWF1_38_23]